MKKIIISENIEKKIIQLLINESIGGYSDKVNIIKQYLDGNFIKADFDSMNSEGDISTTPLVIVLDSKKQPTQHRLSLKQLFEKLQYKYQNIITDTKERDKFLWQLVIDWYQNKISKQGNLTNY